MKSVSFQEPAESRESPEMVHEIVSVKGQHQQHEPQQQQQQIDIGEQQGRRNLQQPLLAASHPGAMREGNYKGQQSGLGEAPQQQQRLLVEQGRVGEGMGVRDRGNEEAEEMNGSKHHAGHFVAEQKVMQFASDMGKGPVLELRQQQQQQQHQQQYQQQQHLQQQPLTMDTPGGGVVPPGLGPLSRGAFRAEREARVFWQRWKGVVSGACALAGGWGLCSSWTSQQEAPPLANIVVIPRGGPNSTADDHTVLNLTQLLQQVAPHHAQFPNHHGHTQSASFWETAAEKAADKASFWWGWIQGRGPHTQEYVSLDRQLQYAQLWLHHQQQQQQVLYLQQQQQQQQQQQLLPNPATGGITGSMTGSVPGGVTLAPGTSASTSPPGLVTGGTGGAAVGGPAPIHPQLHPRFSPQPQPAQEGGAGKWIDYGIRILHFFQMGRGLVQQR